MDKGIASKINANQQDRCLPVQQLSPGRAPGTGCIEEMVVPGERNCVLPQCGYGMGRVQRTHHTGPLAEQLRQNADTRRGFLHIKFWVIRLNIGPGMSGQHQQPVLHILG
ncbi:hypothetical protein D3C87_1791380 [compost metagenome]